MKHCIKELKRAIESSQRGKMSVHRQYVVEALHLLEVVSAENERLRSLVERQNLNAIKRQEFGRLQQWSLDFFCSPDFEPLKRKVFRKLNSRVQGQQVAPHNDPEYCGLLALFSEYAERVKRGDV